MERRHEIYVPHLGWLRHPANDDVALFLNQGWYEYKEQALLWLYLRPGEVVLDCGAHFGLFSVLAARAMGDEGRVLALEPNPEVFGILGENIKGEGRRCIEAVEAAVSSADGTAAFFAESGGKTAYGSMSPGAEGGEEIRVKTITLDSLCKGRGLTRVALVKMDVEGWELETLKGARESSGSGVFSLLMVEFSERNLEQVGATTRDLFDALASSGYTVCRFDEAALELVPQAYEGPVWYENYFATADPEAVNERLRTCTPEAKRVAEEILVRGQAARRQYDVVAAAAERERRLERELDGARSEVRGLERHLREVFRSRYLRMGWKTGVVKKPGWVDDLVRRVDQEARENDETRPGS